MEARKQERKQKRRHLHLKRALISSSLRKRYQFALGHVVTFLADCNIFVGHIDELDDAVCSWLEYIFYEGEAKGLASDALGSLQYHLPQAAGHLRMSWKLVKAWLKLEPPVRVIPLSPLLARAFAGACVIMGRIAEAAVVLAAFDGLLRPGDMYLVEARDVTFYPGKAVWALRDTKTGKRKWAGEIVIINSTLANYWLRKACALRALVNLF